MNIFKIILAVSFFAAPVSLKAQTVIKFATLAPEGTSWTKILREFSKEIKEKTSGRVDFKIYAGGISGDEKDVVRKIRIGQLNAAGFTGFGIGEIAPEMRVLDAPFLFENTKEIDHIYAKMDEEFKNIFLKKGFVLLGYSEVGEVYVFSKEKVSSMEELSKVKMWIWEGDPIAQATFEAFGIKPIPLSITDVMTSIQTGMINSVYGTLNTIIPLQWHSKMKYALDMPITNASGAVLLSKKTFDLMSKEDQALFMNLSAKHFKKLNETSRLENTKGRQALNGKFIEFISLSKEEKEKIKLAGKKASERLAGKVYSKELIEKIEKELENLRKKK